MSVLILIVAVAVASFVRDHDLVNQKIKHVVMNARGLCPVVLEEIEVGIPAFVKRDNLTINDRVVREVREGLEN